MSACFDAVDVAAIPSGATTVLAYIDGRYVTLPAVRARFPEARILTVTTTGLHRADICDVESGDATPAIAAAGVREGLYGVVYSSAALLGELSAAMRGLVWRWFAADWTGLPHLVSGSVATQWASPGHGSVGNYDISTLLDSAWPVAVLPVPTTKELENMTSETASDGTIRVYCAGAGDRAGQLLEFTRWPADPTKNSVIDITAQIGGADPYTVQP